MSALEFASAWFVLGLAAVVAYAYSRAVYYGHRMYSHVVLAALFVAAVEAGVIFDSGALVVAANGCGCAAMLLAIARFR